MDGRTNGPTDQRTKPLIEMRGRILKVQNHLPIYDDQQKGDFDGPIHDFK